MQGPESCRPSCEPRVVVAARDGLAGTGGKDAEPQYGRFEGPVWKIQWVQITKHSIELARVLHVGVRVCWCVSTCVSTLRLDALHVHARCVQCFCMCMRALTAQCLCGSIQTTKLLRIQPSRLRVGESTIRPQLSERCLSIGFENHALQL
jgi:hypothetical protein